MLRAHRALSTDEAVRPPGGGRFPSGDVDVRRFPPFIYIAKVHRARSRTAGRTVAQ
jgi:hypothetical protein